MKPTFPTQATSTVIPTGATWGFTHWNVHLWPQVPGKPWWIRIQNYVTLHYLPERGQFYKQRTSFWPLATPQPNCSYHFRGDFNSEGWLVLTENSLCLYDREPRRTTRKPITAFKFDSPELAFVVLHSVEQRLLPYASPSRQLPLAFGIQQLSSSATEHAAFVVSTIQSKIEWVEAIETVLSKCSRTFEVVKPQARELKSVSVVPIKTTRQSTGSSGKGEEILNFSITSSMLESPTSVSDVWTLHTSNV